MHVRQKQNKLEFIENQMYSSKLSIHKFKPKISKKTKALARLSIKRSMERAQSTQDFYKARTSLFALFDPSTLIQNKHISNEVSALSKVNHSLQRSQSAMLKRQVDTGGFKNQFIREGNDDEEKKSTNLSFSGTDVMHTHIGSFKQQKEHFRQISNYQID